MLYTLLTIFVLSMSVLGCQPKKISTRTPTTLAPATAAQSEQLNEAIAQASNSPTQNTQINTPSDPNNIDISSILTSLKVDPMNAVELLTNTGKNIFNSLDSDNSKSVTYQELQQSSLFNSVPEEYKKQLFEYLQANNDQVNFEEFAAKVITQVDLTTLLSILQSVELPAQ